MDRPRGCRHVRTCPGGRPEPRTGRNGSQPRPRGTRGAKSGRGGEIPREEMTNTTRVGPEQALRGRGRCRGVAPTPTDEAEASGWPADSTSSTVDPRQLSAKVNREVNRHSSPHSMHARRCRLLAAAAPYPGRCALPLPLVPRGRVLPDALPALTRQCHASVRG